MKLFSKQPLTLEQQLLEIWENAVREPFQWCVDHRFIYFRFGHNPESRIYRIEKNYQDAQNQCRLQKREDPSENPVQPSEHYELNACLDDFSDEMEQEDHYRNHQYEHYDVEYPFGNLEIGENHSAHDFGKLICNPSPGDDGHERYYLFGEALYNSLYQSRNQANGQYDIQRAHPFYIFLSSIKFLSLRIAKIYKKL